MGSICHIITRERVSVPPEMPHFWIRGVLSIPIDCDAKAMELFMDLFWDGQLNPLNQQRI
jgi:hypothetical protein